MPHPRPDVQQRQLILAAAYAVHVFGFVIQLYAAPLYWKQDYHTSKLTSAQWVEELIYGHPDRIRTELGVHVHVFLILVEVMESGIYVGSLTPGMFLSRSKLQYFCICVLPASQSGMLEKGFNIQMKLFLS